MVMLLGNHSKGPGFKTQCDYQSMTMFLTLLSCSSQILYQIPCLSFEHTQYNCAKALLIGKAFPNYLLYHIFSLVYLLPYTESFHTFVPMQELSFIQLGPLCFPRFLHQLYKHFSYHLFQN